MIHCIVLCFFHSRTCAQRLSLREEGQVRFRLSTNPNRGEITNPG